MLREISAVSDRTSYLMFEQTDKPMTNEMKQATGVTRSSGLSLLLGLVTMYEESRPGGARGQGDYCFLISAGEKKKKRVSSLRNW